MIHGPDRQLFETEFSSHLPQLGRWILGSRPFRRFVNSNDAADVMQQCLIGIWRRWATYRGLDEPQQQAYTWQVTNRTIAAYIARERRDNELWNLILSGESFTPAGVPLAQHVIESPELWDSAVWEALGDLTPRQRIAMLLFYVDGWSVDDIASRFACTPSSVKTHLKRGRDKARRSLLLTIELSPATADLEDLA